MNADECFMMMLKTWIGLIVITFIFFGENAKASTPLVVRYLELGDMQSVHAYKFKLIHRALELTREEFGDYQNIPYQGADLSQTRYAKLISEGEILNIAWGSPGTALAKANVITIPFDILKGLLGYRICLTNGKVPES
jgi:hypothetical protein